MAFNNTPSMQGDEWKAGDKIGSLIFTEYYEYVNEVPTKFGTMPGVRVLVTVIEGAREEVGKTYDTMFFNNSLVRIGKRCLDRGKFLGRLGKAQFKNGEGVTLLEATPSDMDTARRFEEWMAKGGPDSAQQSGGNGQAQQSQASAPPQQSQAQAPPQPQPVPAAGGGTYTDDSPPF